MSIGATSDATDMNPPEISDALLKYLDAQFPDACPDPKDSNRKIWIAVGARRVVRHLQGLHKEQTENVQSSRPIGPTAGQSSGTASVTLGKPNAGATAR